MVPKEFLLIAGDAESDRLAAELVTALRLGLTEAEMGYAEGAQPLHASLEPRFYGAGGPRMASAGVSLASDIAGGSGARSNPFLGLLRFRRIFAKLYHLALEREPHVVIGIGFFGFNLRFARAIKRFVRHEQGTFHNWDPQFVQVVAPPWATRPPRARQLSRDIDCLLSTDTSEEIWYAVHAPDLRVEFIGPLDRDSAMAEVARRAARAIVQLLMESEAHFP
ncbi:MAG TPA: hypothetical protein VNZ22_08010, partial [Bacillota bacterium]|nr:hypothetical protein [Bacillota bacterium]